MNWNSIEKGSKTSENDIFDKIEGLNSEEHDRELIIIGFIAGTVITQVFMAFL